MLFLKTSCRQRGMGSEWKFENAGIDGTMFGVFYSLSIRHSTQSCRRDWARRRVKGNELRYKSWKTHVLVHTHIKRLWIKYVGIKINFLQDWPQMHLCAYSGLADFTQTDSSSRLCCLQTLTHAHSCALWRALLKYPRQYTQYTNNPIPIYQADSLQPTHV